VQRVLIGGVGYRWQRDASFGLVVTDALSSLEWPPHVEVADLGYGALYVAQDLADADPPYTRLVLVAGVERGRVPGQVYPGTWGGSEADPDEIQARIREAGAGVLDLDHLLVIASHFGALPREVITVELEPVDASGGDGLSAFVISLLPSVIQQVRELALQPLAEEVAT
jgi:hydrogenase maturation protease